MTGPRPQNPGGGLPRYNTSLGTATLMNGITLVFAGTANEDTLPILSGNTFTAARKLPPICSSELSAAGHFASQVYSKSQITLPGGAYFFRRWLGGDITVAVANGAASWNIIIWPINPPTVTVAFASGQILGTVFGCGVFQQI